MNKSLLLILTRVYMILEMGAGGPKSKRKNFD